MNSLRKILINCINRIGQSVSRRFQRRIADFPGVLKFFKKLSTGEQVEITTPEGCHLNINPLFHSNLISTHDLRNYEPEIREVILKFTRSDMVAYDIGANVGIFSFLFASIVGEDGLVYSFEPEENNYTCLEKSIEKHDKKNMVLDKRAVGNTKSTEKFDRRGGAFSGRLIGNGLYHTTGNIKTVETVSIDYVVNEEGYRVPDILKIDVEGNEGMVLEGMKNIMATHSPIVICELHTHLGESKDHVINLLSCYGYTISNVRDVLAMNSPSETPSNTPFGRHIVAINHTKKHSKTLHQAPISLH
jgi:FkbM family methyltransferase